MEARNFRVVVWTICFHYFLAIELPMCMIAVLLVGPSLISQDLRFNALPLYFSRPLRRIDYFAGKLGVIAWFLGMVIILPSLIVYVLGLLFSLDITIVWDTFGLLAACLAYGFVVVLSAGTLMLALSSLSRNSRYIALFWVALWFVSGIVASILAGVEGDQRRHRQDQIHAEYRSRMQRGKGGPRPEDRARQEAALKAQAEWVLGERQAARTDWRPLVSYTANLSRVGQLLLNTDAAWQKWSETQPPEYREVFLLGNLGPQYPWYWSAGVLAGFLGLSLCILNLRVRSLDRLK
jgi:ABC-2 type transport system permease protein